MASGRTWITKEPDGEVARPELPDHWLPKSAPALTGELNRSRKPLAKQLPDFRAGALPFEESRNTSQFMVAPPQHLLYFFPEPHWRGWFRLTLEAVCQGVVALLLRTMASPSYGGAVMLATDHTGSACRSIVRGWCQGHRTASRPFLPKFPRYHSRCVTGRLELPQGAWRRL
jgi:hypothetical protein